jgi:hypothetical protein
MPINPAIAMGTRGVELADPLAQYGRVAAIQSAQQQNQLAQLQMQQAQREQEATNALNRAYAEALNPATGEVDINKLRQSVSTGGFGSKLPGIEKQLGEVATQRLQQKKLQGEIASQEAGLIDTKLKQARSFLDTIDPADPAAPAKYIAWQQANYNDPVLGPVLKNRGVSEAEFRSQVAQAVQRGPQAFAELLNRSKLGTEKFIELNKPVITQQTLGGEVRAIATPGLGGAATVVPGSTAQVTMTPAQIEEDKRARERIRQEGQRLGLEGRRVAVLEANARRDSDPVFQQQMATARATGEAIAKGDVAAQQALPKIISRAQESLRLIDEMVGKPEVRDASGKVIQAATKPHPGFQGAVGATWLPGARFVPGTDAADFTARFDQAKGSSFLEAFESIKGAGAITEKEGAKATDAINRMSLAQSEKEFMSAARDLQDVIRKGVENAQRKAGGAARGAPAGGGGVDTNNPLLK